jgi:DNA mismatch endonuclease, patch repair protein
MITDLGDHASGSSVRGSSVKFRYPVPGLPRRTIDIAFPRARVAVLVHSCLWHRCPTHATQPKANPAWWTAKIERNVLRDAETETHLRSLGWVTVTVWEHEEPGSAADRVVQALGSVRRSP